MTETRNSDGSLFDDFLRDEDIYEEVTIAAAARVLVWELQEKMRDQGITKPEVARRMGTSRSQIKR